MIDLELSLVSRLLWFKRRGQ